MIKSTLQYHHHLGIVLIACLSLLALLSLTMLGMMTHSHINYRLEQQQRAAIHLWAQLESALSLGETIIDSFSPNEIMVLSDTPQHLPYPLMPAKLPHEWLVQSKGWWEDQAQLYAEDPQKVYYAIEWINYVPESVSPDEQAPLFPIGRYHFRVSAWGLNTNTQQQHLLQTTWLRELKQDDILNGAWSETGNRLAWRQLM